MRLISALVFVALPLAFAVPFEASFSSLRRLYLINRKLQRRDPTPGTVDRRTAQSNAAPSASPAAAGSGTAAPATDPVTGTLGGLNGGGLPVVGSLTTLPSTVLGLAGGLGGVTGVLSGVGGVKARDLETLSAPLLKRIVTLAIDISAELDARAGETSPLKSRDSTSNQSTPLSQTISPAEIQSLADGTGFSVPDISSLPSAALPILEALAASNTRRLGGGLSGVGAT